MSASLQDPDAASRPPQAPLPAVSSYPYHAPTAAAPHTAIEPSITLSSPQGAHDGPITHPAAAPSVGIAPPPYSERPTYSTPRQLTFAHAASVATGGHVELTPPPERKRRSILEPLELPSPFAKAPKSRVSNFKEGLREGGLGAWAEVREGLKGPVALTWYWAKEGGAIGALNGLGYGTAILALCPISASIAFINHSSRGAIRGVRSAKEQRRLKKAAPSPSTPSALSPTSGPLSMDRTATMESAVTSRSRRSRVGNLLSRVTSTRSTPGPITPSDDHADAAQVAGDAEADGRITPFTPTSPAGPSSRDIVAGKRREPTRLEMDTKWGSPTEASGSGSGSGSRGVEETPLPRLDGVNQLEMDTKWGPPPPSDAPPRLDGLQQIELDTKWGSVLPPLEPPQLPNGWHSNAEAGPSTRGTPQLETDIKWPIISSPEDHQSGWTEPPRQLPALAIGQEVEASERQAREEETSALEMQLKWEKEMARAGRG